MNLLRIAMRTVWYRRSSVLLTIFSIAVSMFLLLGVDKIRREAKNNFILTVSKTDLIVGARSGAINLLLYSVFHIGNATNNISWESYQEISQLEQVAWTIPLSLGDSHRGFRVVGTTNAYFDHYRFGRDRALIFREGGPMSDLYDAVLGSDVARSLGYQLNDPLVITHGAVSADFADHDDKPFRIVGILEQTGTPVDRAVHISLEGIEAIHVDWKSGAQSPFTISAEQTRALDLQPRAITAFMIGLNNRIDTFQLQRKINEYRAEPLLAILPGATLAEFWVTLSSFEQLLFAISFLVLITGLLGMLTAILSTLNERRHEIALLRAIGARPYHILYLFQLETLLIVVIGSLLGMGGLYLTLTIGQTWLSQTFGLYVTNALPHIAEWRLVAVAIFLGQLIAVIPALLAYRRSLQDGLTAQA